MGLSGVMPPPHVSTGGYYSAHGTTVFSCVSRHYSWLIFMGNVCHLICEIEPGELLTTDQIYPLAYDDLIALAARLLTREKTGHPLEPSALVNEAYEKLKSSPQKNAEWDGRGHFFAAASKAMRQVLVDHARHKGRQKEEGHLPRLDLDIYDIEAPETAHAILALEEALTHLQVVNPDAARLVHLRYFAGLNRLESAKILDASPRSIDRLWAFAKAWLFREIQKDLADS